MENVSAVTVDSYTTLVNVGSQADVLENHVPDIEDGRDISRTWRNKYIEYSIVANDIDEYRPFWELIGDGLRYALEAHNYAVSTDVREQIRREVYQDRLTVYDDVTDGIKRLVDAGYPVYILSNGNPEMLSHLVDSAELNDLITDTISADDVETYKPDPAIYQYAGERIDTPLEEVVHVSGGGLRDVWGAKHAGMQAAWLNRPSQNVPRERLGEDPDITFGTLHELPDALGKH